jgi:hypothetical protein
MQRSLLYVQSHATVTIRITCVSMRLRWPLGPAALERRQPIATRVLMCVDWRPHFDAHNHAPCIDDSVLKHHRQRLRSEDEAIEVIVFQIMKRSYRPSPSGATGSNVK